MPIFCDAIGIMTSSWCVRYPVKPHFITSYSFSLKIDAGHRYIGNRSSDGPKGLTATVPASQAARLVGHDASHRAKRKGTHLTHWPAADFLGSPRMRSGGVVLAHTASRVFPRLVADARRVRAGGGR